MKAYIDRLREIGYEKPRAALALLALAFFGILYFLIGFNAPPGWSAAFFALALCYLTAFMALASEWFWARWFASGLGWSGAMVGVFALVIHGWQPALAVYGGLHALVVAMLAGPKIAARYDLQPAWRERFAMDDFGVQRLRKAVTRGSAALPSLILWALGPREEAASTAILLMAVALTTLGLSGLVRLRSWGVLALGGATLAAFAALGLTSGLGQGIFAGTTGAAPFAAVLAPMAVAALLWLPLAVLPFVGPVARYLRAR